LLRKTGTKEEFDKRLETGAANDWSGNMRNQPRYLTVLLVFIGFVLAGAFDSFGQTETGDTEMAAEEKYSEKECHKKFAVDLNNLVWNLLGEKDRTSDEDEKMIHAAHGSLFHWSAVGTAVNMQRGQWLVSHVYVVLNRPEPAIYHAEKCMQLTEENNFVDFDLAYAYEGMARAYAASGKKTECEKYIQLAEQAGGKIEKKEDRELFFSDFESGPWYGMK
jgi:hypothetical protein